MRNSATRQATINNAIRCLLIQRKYLRGQPCPDTELIDGINRSLRILAN